MNNHFEGFINKKQKAVNVSKERIVQGLSLKKIQQNDSFHSSVLITERNSSMRNSINSTILHNDSSFAHTMSHSSFRTSRVTNHNQNSIKKSTNMLKMSTQKLHQQKILSISRRQTPVKKSSLPKIGGEREPINIEGVLKKYIDTNFVHSLMSFVNKDWEQQEQILLREKRFEALRNVITQKTSLLNMLTEEFMTMEYDKFEENQKKLVCSLLFKQNKKVLTQYEGLFSEILKKIPQDKIVKQENQIEELYTKLCQIFDPKYINSNEKMKERVQLFMEGYKSQKNNLLASIATKLKGNLDFVSLMQKYLSLYQKQVIKIRNQLYAAETERTNLSNLLKKKVNFTPIQMDYQRIQQIKEESKKQFFQDLEGNYIKYHENLHKKNNKNIEKQEKQNSELKKQLQQAKAEIAKLKQKIYDMIHSVPKKIDASTQLFLISESLDSKIARSSSMMISFLSNVSTPFSFTQKVTGSLINLLSIDKILYDYEIIRNKHQLQYFPQFLIQWFLVRTGSKKVAQIFTKNFMYSCKELKNRHKRFNLFTKICGFNGFRKKNIQEDLEYIFFQTHKAWNYLIKIALIYRRKMNENPTGYHLFPPLACEGIFKLPLRKIYELIQQFLTQEGIQIPSDLTNRIDYYAINQISKFKSHDQNFQKEQLQEIHILREINFDIIAGFIIQYIARDKCLVIEKLLRTISMKQKEIHDVLGYSEFEGIYRRYYKERRAKIEHVYSKICVLNQHDMMDIENAEPIIRVILEDQSGMRNLFQDNQSLKALIMTEKTNIQKSDKIAINPNSYQNFRDRYYYEFYDFYNTTAFLEEIYRIIKSLIKKKLKQFIKDEQKLEELTTEKQPLEYVEGQKQKSEISEPSSDEDEYSENEGEPEKKKTHEKQKKQAEQNAEKKKQYLEGKVQQWGKIIVRIPHFVQKILTIDQIIVHNMRRKQMIDASQFAWRTLRDLLIVISKN